MRIFNLVPRLTPDAAQTLWFELEPAFDEPGAGISLEGSAVTYLSAAGLQVLLMAQRRVAADGKKFALTAPSQALQEALCCMGADDIFAEAMA